MMISTFFRVWFFFSNDKRVRCEMQYATPNAVLQIIDGFIENDNWTGKPFPWHKKNANKHSERFYFTFSNDIKWIDISCLFFFFAKMNFHVSIE